MAEANKAVVAKRVNVSAMDFVKVVVEVVAAGGTHADVAARLGIKQTSVATRCSQLRSKHGVKLPNFKRGGGNGRALDVDALNAIVAGN